MSVSEGEVPDIVQRAIKQAQVESIVNKRSRQVTEVVEEYAGGAVKVFGETFHPEEHKRYGDVSRAQRTEIAVEGATVKVHNDYGTMGGIFGTCPHFGAVEVTAGDKTRILKVAADSQTSPYNPVYEFTDAGTGEKVGVGYGQSINLRLASYLTGDKHIPGGTDYVDWSVVKWIKDTVKSLLG